ALYERCDRRFELMLEQGALEEAEEMMARDLDPLLPAMKALGAPELFAYLRDEMSREDAVYAAKQGTRNFAKRQMTWMRNQMSDWGMAG
ncbi:MAG: tRNA dimethylallyltransferase, partial [Pseudomonadota bacterium]